MKRKRFSLAFAAVLVILFIACGNDRNREFNWNSHIDFNPGTKTKTVTMNGNSVIIQAETTLEKDWYFNRMKDSIVKKIWIRSSDNPFKSYFYYNLKFDKSVESDTTGVIKVYIERFSLKVENEFPLGQQIFF